MNEARVVQEINEELDRLAEAREPWVAAWVANTVCGQHRVGLADNEHAGFWEWTGYKSVREFVTRVINQRAGPNAKRNNGHQLVLEGFDRSHLQDYYVVERSGQQTGVPVIYCTDDELLAKAAEYRVMARSVEAHAKEIEAFIAWRREAKAG